MARRLRYLILAALLICLGAGLSYSIVRGHLLKRPDRLLEEAARLVDLRLENIDYTQITEGRREWSLKATHVDFKEKDDLFTLEGVRLILYQKSNHHLKIEGDKGLYNRKDRWIKVMGRAKISSDEGYLLSSESFHYQIEEQILTSNEHVVLTGPGLKIEGLGLKVELREGKAKFLGNVVSEFSEDSEGKDA